MAAVSKSAPDCTKPQLNRLVELLSEAPCNIRARSNSRTSLERGPEIKPVDTATLAGGDEVQIGKFRFVYLSGPRTGEPAG
jgi:hypothetical protein